MDIIDLLIWVPLDCGVNSTAGQVAQVADLIIYLRLPKVDLGEETAYS